MQFTRFCRFMADEAEADEALLELAPACVDYKSLQNYLYYFRTSILNSAICFY